MKDDNFEELEIHNSDRLTLSTMESPKHIRISVKWTDKMLMAAAAACDIKIEVINLIQNKSALLFKGRGKVTRFSHGYSNCEWGEGMTGTIFDKEVRPLLDVMMRSYLKGMCLENDYFHWITDLQNWSPDVKKSI